MTRLISVLIIGCLMPFYGLGQNIFDLENSRKFASYLFQSGQYDLASDEYERVIFMKPDDSLSMLPLLSSYRHQKEYALGLKRATQLLPSFAGINEDLSTEIFHISLLAERFDKAEAILQKTQALGDQERRNYRLSMYLIQQDMEKASDLIASNRLAEDEFYIELQNLHGQYQDLPNKKPWLAAGFSTFLPGLGKIYTGNWQDGLIALLFVGTNGWQAYRGFKEDGIKSAYGWVFGSISAGFYLGNIYGSFRAARKYNQKKQKLYHDQVKRTVFSTF